MESNTGNTTAPSNVRMAQPQAKLTDKAIKALKPRPKVYEEGDGNGLWLVVRPTGTKVWRWEFRFLGKAQNRSFGQYPAVTLSMARSMRDQGKAMLAQGINPAVHHKAKKEAEKRAHEHSFKSVAQTWWERWRKKVSAKHADIAWRNLERNVFPVIGSKPVSEIKPQDLISLSRAIEKRTTVGDLATAGYAVRRLSRPIVPGSLWAQIEQ